MRVARRARGGWAVPALAVGLSLIPRSASAGGSRGSGGAAGNPPAAPSGGADGGTLYAGVVQYDDSRNGSGPASGSVAPTSDWKPPACWYEPKWMPEEFEREFQRRWDVPHFSGAGEAYAMDQDRYIDGKPYEDFNEDKSGDGMWWHVVRDEAREDALDPAAFACNEAAFWADNGEAPQVENAITPEILAQLAYRRIKVPGTAVSLAPAGATKVSLPTWAWLDSATSLRLEPGTKNAQLFPASGECTFNDNASIGEPYAEGKAERTPPCRITYLRSSGNGTFSLRATITWDITWTGTGVPGSELPSGTFGDDQAVTVQEIQSANP